MNVLLSQRPIEDLAAAPPAVQKAYIKQMNLLARNLMHPSLRAKKYEGAEARWQARVNQDWPFYFTMIPGGYHVTAIVPHPK